ncbi:hypothetical protein GPECTOR_28g844 [Gonium pectorale]|uniref:Uncharacterized protein n=1 Tax=Gonium pectorale TaxID=33097 RepID=A0A150GF30_GONPE|nr:hypothetical protein GPECTOR_28g844 [Gonium pectorale]|eukprot:KXZ48434.1 hypothetical protein GPECTOR_28g844 [Gonium pectorale]
MPADGSSSAARPAPPPRSPEAHAPLTPDAAAPRPSAANAASWLSPPAAVAPATLQTLDLSCIALDRRSPAGRSANLSSYFEVLNLELSSAAAAAATATASAAAPASMGASVPGPRTVAARRLQQRGEPAPGELLAPPHPCLPDARSRRSAAADPLPRLPASASTSRLYELASAASAQQQALQQPVAMRFGGLLGWAASESSAASTSAGPTGTTGGAWGRGGAAAAAGAAHAVSALGPPQPLWAAGASQPIAPDCRQRRTGGGAELAAGELGRFGRPDQHSLPQHHRQQQRQQQQQQQYLRLLPEQQQDHCLDPEVQLPSPQLAVWPGGPGPSASLPPQPHRQPARELSFAGPQGSVFALAASGGAGGGIGSVRGSSGSGVGLRALRMPTRAAVPDLGSGGGRRQDPDLTFSALPGSGEGTPRATTAAAAGSGAGSPFAESGPGMGAVFGSAVGNCGGLDFAQLVALSHDSGGGGGGSLHASALDALGGNHGGAAVYGGGLVPYGDYGWLDRLMAAAAAGDQAALEAVVEGLDDGAVAALLRTVELMEVAGSGVDSVASAPLGPAATPPPLGGPSVGFGARHPQQPWRRGSAEGSGGRSPRSPNHEHDRAGAGHCGAARQAVSQPYGCVGSSDERAILLQPCWSREQPQPQPQLQRQRQLLAAPAVVTPSGAAGEGGQASRRSTGAGGGGADGTSDRTGAAPPGGGNRAPAQRSAFGAAGAAAATAAAAAAAGALDGGAAAGEGAGLREDPRGDGQPAREELRQGGADDFHAPAHIAPLMLTTARTIRPRKAASGGPGGGSTPSTGAGGGGGGAAHRNFDPDGATAPAEANPGYAMAATAAAAEAERYAPPSMARQASAGQAMGQFPPHAPSPTRSRCPVMVPVPMQVPVPMVLSPQPSGGLGVLLAPSPSPQPMDPMPPGPATAAAGMAAAAYHHHHAHARAQAQAHIVHGGGYPYATGPAPELPPYHAPPGGVPYGVDEQHRHPADVYMYGESTLASGGEPEPGNQPGSRSRGAGRTTGGGDLLEHKGRSAVRRADMAAAERAAMEAAQAGAGTAQEGHAAEREQWAERGRSRSRSRASSGRSAGGQNGCSPAKAGMPPRDTLSALKWCHVQHSRKQAPALDEQQVKELVRVQLQSNTPIRAPWYRDVDTSRQQAQAAAANLQQRRRAAGKAEGGGGCSGPMQRDEQQQQQAEAGHAQGGSSARRREPQGPGGAAAASAGPGERDKAGGRPVIGTGVFIPGR